MPHVSPVNAREWFFDPFYRARKGSILGLAQRDEPLPDALALILIARMFPQYEFPAIQVVPSRPTVQLAENVILVGLSHRFGDAEWRPRIGSGRASTIPLSKLTSRLQAIERCCFAFAESNGRRHLVNGMTGECFWPTPNDEMSGDYGVIRRLYRGPSENTLTLEGVHSLGTLGAARVATDEWYLGAIRDAVAQIEGFDESRSLEILVHTTFDTKHGHGVYAVDTINARPLAIVYDGYLSYSLVNGGSWRDQRPWDVELCVRGDAPAATRLNPAEPAASEPCAESVPRLEIQIDLSEAAKGTRALCRKLLSNRGASRGRRGEPLVAKAELDKLLECLTPISGDFRVELIAGEAADATGSRARELPFPRSDGRSLRKQFVVHLALRRLFGSTFPCTDESVARFFPDFGARSKSPPTGARFMRGVIGKLRDGFAPLLGPSRGEPGLMEVFCYRGEQAYVLRLGRGSLVLRLRY